MIKRGICLVLAALCVAIGLIGVVLPLLPTTPFMLLALFFAARGSTRFHDWLVNHPRFGPPLVAWQRHGAIPPKAKKAALALIAVSAVSALFLPWGWRRLLIWGPLLAVALFILTRPDGDCPRK